MLEAAIFFNDLSLLQHGTPVTHTSASAHTCSLLSLRHANHHFRPSSRLRQQRTTQHQTNFHYHGYSTIAGYCFAAPPYWVPTSAVAPLRTAQQESFILIYVVFKHILVVFSTHISFMLDRNLQTRFPCWDTSLLE